MAPLPDQTVEQLRELVSKLEARVDQLESKLQQAGGDVQGRTTGSASGSIRMVLMGPPGAGQFMRSISG